NRPGDVRARCYDLGNRGAGGMWRASAQGRTRRSARLTAVRVAVSLQSIDPIQIGQQRWVAGQRANQELQDVLDRAASQTAFTMVLLAIAAIVALFLGVVGIYGVTSYIVSQRTGEIGVRLALGAAPRDVINMIVRQGVSVALAGVIVGLAVALS